MASQNDQPLPDIAFHLNQLGDTTTAAELVRNKGQSTKLKVISEKKLMNWILALLQQHMAGKADALSDEEKQELVAKAQLELQKRLKLEQELSKERERRASELHDAQERLQSSKKSHGDYEAAIAAYKTQLEQRDKTIEDLQQDNFDLQDELNQKIAMIRATLEEKDKEKEKLQHSLRNQMIRSTGLLEGVIGLDNDYYGGKHQNEHPVSEAATPEEAFYHDFDVGAGIIAALAADLQRLRDIAAKGGERQGNLLESDLALLAQLKEGSLSAMDVASPVSSLVEAMEGAREEALAFELAASEATGLPVPNHPVSQVPAENGDPATVLAGITQVTRELEALFARERNRLNALKSMADDADSARNAGEGELEAMRASYDDLVKSVARKGVAADLAVSPDLQDAQIAPAQRNQAAKLILEALAEGAANRVDPEVKVMETGLATRVRDLGQALVATKKARGEPHEAVRTRVVDLDKLIARLNQDIDAVDQGDLLRATQAALDLVQEEMASRDQALAGRDVETQILRGDLAEAKAKAESLHGALEAATHHQAQLAAQIRDLGQTVFPDEQDQTTEVTGSYSVGSRRVAEIGKALEGDDAAKVAASAKGLLESLRKDAGKLREKLQATKVEAERSHGENLELHDRVDALVRDLAEAKTRADELQRSERELSQKLIEAAQGDATLADTAADLAITLDDPDATVSDLNAHTKQAVIQLVKRKQQLDAELVALRSETVERKSQVQARNQVLESELAKAMVAAAAATSGLEQARKDLETERASASDGRNEAVETAAAAKEVIQQLRQQMESRDAELAILREQSEGSSQELTDLRQRVAGAEAATKLLADTLAGLSRLAAKDEGLAPARQALEHALEEMPGELGIVLRPESAGRIASAAQGLVGTMAMRLDEIAEAESERTAALATSQQTQARLSKESAEAKARVQELEKDLQEHSADAVETAATAKEMITTMQAQMAHRDERLRDLRAKDEQQAGELAETKARLVLVDEANRKLSEILSELATSEIATAPELGHLEAVEEARIDLELTLSELPAEGERGVDVSPDLSRRLAEAGQKTAEALAGRRRQITKDLSAAKASSDVLGKEVEQLRKQLETSQKSATDRESHIKRSQAELESMRKELKEQAAGLATKIADLSETRSRLANVESELEDLRRTTAEATKNSASLRNELDATKASLEQIADLQTRVDTAEAAATKLAASVQGLGTWEDPDVAAVIAPGGSPMAKSTQRFHARKEAKSVDTIANGAQQFLAGVRDQMAAIAVEVANARKRLVTQDASLTQLQGDLSAARASVIARERDAEVATRSRAEAEARAGSAETAARELASAISLVASDVPAGTKLNAAITDSKKLLDPKTVQAAVAAMHQVAERIRVGESERARAAAAADEVREHTERTERTLASTKESVARANHDAEEARASERALASASAELSRDILTAAKSMATDVKPETAEEAQHLLEEFDGMSAERRLSAAASFMPTLRELFTTLAIGMAESRSELESLHVRLGQESAGLKSDLDRARAEIDRLHQAAKAADDERSLLASEIAAAAIAIAKAKADREALDSSLLQAEAELEDFRARGGAAAGSAKDENSELRQKVDAERKLIEEAELQIATLKEKLSATEARMTKGREELSQRLAERDQLIADKTRELEELTNQATDVHVLQANVEGLGKELASTHKELERYKQVHGELSGATAQAGDLRKALKSADSEREGLRGKIRELENELADKKGDFEEAVATLDAKTKEMASLREKKDKELEQERTAVAKAREGERRLKEENVGLKARVRRLTEG